MTKIPHSKIDADMHYLQLLAQSFPTIADASTEIINLEAIMALPKGTEHFLADLHGESEAFRHVLKNASGNIKRKVNELFGNDIREVEKKELCTLIYYPEQKLELIKAQEKDIEDWYRITIHQLVKICRDVSSKYTRSKVRKSLPQDFAYIIEELLQPVQLCRPEERRRPGCQSIAHVPLVDLFFLRVRLQHPAKNAIAIVAGIRLPNIQSICGAVHQQVNTSLL